MTTAAPTTALVMIQPAFTDAERLALAGYLAGYRGLTREAYALDRLQFTALCRDCSLPLFAVRRADIEGFDAAWSAGAMTAILTASPHVDTEQERSPRYPRVRGYRFAKRAASAAMPERRLVTLSD